MGKLFATSLHLFSFLIFFFALVVSSHHSFPSSNFYLLNAVSFWNYTFSSPNPFKPSLIHSLAPALTSPDHWSWHRGVTGDYQLFRVTSGHRQHWLRYIRLVLYQYTKYITLPSLQKIDPSYHLDFLSTT